MSGTPDRHIAICWVSRQDFRNCRPDLRDRINALDETDMQYIADRIGDALQDTYWLAMSVMLSQYLGIPDGG